MKKSEKLESKNVPFRIASWLSATRDQFKSKSLSQTQKKSVSMPKLNTHHPHKQYFSDYKPFISGGQLKASKTQSLQKNKTEANHSQEKTKSLKQSRSYKSLSNQSEAQHLKRSSAQQIKKPQQIKQIKIQEAKRKPFMKGLISDTKIFPNKKKLVIDKGNPKKQYHKNTSQGVEIRSKQNQKYLLIAQEDFMKPLKVEQFRKQLKIESLVMNERGILLFYSKNQLNQYPIHELLSFSDFYQRLDRIKKINQNVFFQNFFKIKYFSKWRGIMRNTNMNKTKKQIARNLESYDIKYLRNLSKYNQLIIKAYFQEFPNSEIFLIENIENIKIPVSSYQREVVAIITQRACRNLKTEVFEQILKDYFMNLRNWLSQCVEKGKEKNINSVQLGGQFSKICPHPKQSSFQSYKIKHKIQQDKKMLKKIFYIIEQNKLNFLLNLIREILWKIQSNFKNYLQSWQDPSQHVNSHQNFPISTSNLNNSIHLNNKSIINGSSKFQIKQKPSEIQLTNTNQIKSEPPQKNKSISKGKKQQKSKVKFQCAEDSSEEKSKIYSNDNINFLHGNKLLRTIQNILKIFNGIFKPLTSSTQIEFQPSSPQISLQKQSEKFSYDFENHLLRFVPFFIVMNLEDTSKKVNEKTIKDRNFQEKQNDIKEQHKYNFEGPKDRATKNQQASYVENELEIQMMKQTDLLIDQIIKMFSNRLGSQSRVTEQSNELDDGMGENIPELIKQSYCRLDFVNNMALKGEINQKQFKIVNQVVNSVDEYHFSKILSINFPEISKIKGQIQTIISMNFLQVKRLKKTIIKVFREIRQKINKYEMEYRIYDYYQMINRFLLFLREVSGQIRIGNVVVSIEPILVGIKDDIQKRKKRLVIETPERFSKSYTESLGKLDSYIQEISLTCWTLSEFVKSYKKSQDFKRECKKIEEQELPSIYNLVLLINISTPKLYEGCYLKYLELSDTLGRIHTKTIKFEQSISKKLKLLQPQKIQEIKKTEKEIELMIRKLVSSVQKQTLVVQKCQQEIQELNEFVCVYDVIIKDLELIQELEVTHCIKESNDSHFHSFGKIKNEIKYILKLLKSYKEFECEFRQEIRKEFRSVRTEYFSEKLSRERVKIKHANRVLYQFQIFIINCYSLYDKFKSEIELISIIKRLDRGELQKIYSINQLFCIYDNFFLTAQTIISIPFTDQEIKQIQDLLNKKQFQQLYTKTLSQIQLDISRITFQVKKDQLHSQNLILNLTQNLALIQSLNAKLQSLKDVKKTLTSENPTEPIFNKVNQAHELINRLNECQTEYLKLIQRKFKMPFLNEPSFQNDTQNNNSLSQIRSRNKQLWNNLMDVLHHAYLDHIINYMLGKVKDMTASLSCSIEREWNSFQTIINRAKEQTPLLSLLSDHVILQILESPQFFYTYTYNFVEKASIKKYKKSVNLELTTIYDQKIVVLLKKVNQKVSNSSDAKRSQEQISKTYPQQLKLENKMTNKNNIGQGKQKFNCKTTNPFNQLMRDLSISKINQKLSKELEELLFKFKFQKAHLTKIKISQMQQSKLPLSLIYIVDQISLIAILTDNLSSDQTISNLSHKLIQSQLSALIQEYSDFDCDLSNYQTHVVSLLVLSKIQFRDKVDFVVREAAWQENQYLSMLKNLFSYCSSNSEIYFICYDHQLPLHYEFVDYKNIAAIEPICEKIYISLVNSMVRSKCGILQDSSNLINLMARTLHFPRHIIFQSQKQLQCLFKLGSKQNVSFIIQEATNTPISYQIYHQIFTQIQILKAVLSQLPETNLIKSNLKEVIWKQKSRRDQQRKIYCPTIFIESGTKIYYRSGEFQFDMLEMRKSFRLIQHCKPSFSFQLKMKMMKHKLQISDEVKYWMIEKFYELQSELIRQQNYFISTKDIEKIIKDLFDYSKQFNRLNREVVHTYFALYHKQINPDQYCRTSFQRQSIKGQDFLKNIRQNINRRTSNFTQNYSVKSQTLTSPSLLSLSRQFNSYILKGRQKIILYGNSLTGKTHFINHYFNQTKKKYPSSATLNSSSIIFQEINLSLECIFSAFDMYHYFKIKKLSLQGQQNKKPVILLKDIDEKNMKMIQSIVICNKFNLQQGPSINIGPISFVMQVRQLHRLPPKVIFQCRKLYFKENTVDWGSILITKTQQITNKFFLPQNEKQSIKQHYAPKNQADVLNRQQIGQEKQITIRKHPLQIFGLVFEEFFEHIQFKKYFTIPISRKYLILSTITLFESVLYFYENQITQIYLAQDSISADRQSMIREIFLYAFYWTCYWILQPNLLKNFDFILKENLSRHSISLTQVKFFHLITFKNQSIDFIYQNLLGQSNNFSISNQFSFLKQKNSNKLETHETFYIDSFETKIYKHFLSILSCSLKPILVYGKQSIGKSALIRNYMRTSNNPYVIVNLGNHQNSFEKAIQKILALKIEPGKKDAGQILNQTANECSNDFNSSKSIMKEGRSTKRIKSQKRLKQSMKQIQMRAQNEVIPKRMVGIKYILIEDLSLKSRFFHFFAQFVRQNNRIPLPNLNSSLKNYQNLDLAPIYFDMKETVLIREAPVIQVQQQFCSKFQHYYPFHVFFDQQNYVDEMIGTYFENTIRNNFNSNQDVQQIIKNRPGITKSFLRLYQNLSNFFALDKNNHNAPCLNKKQNRLIRFNLRDILKIFRHEKGKTRKQFIQNISNKCRIHFSSRLNNRTDQERLDAIVKRFLDGLIDNLYLKGINLEQLINQKPFNSSAENKAIQTEKQLQEFFIKKVQYQSKHKKFKINENIKSSLGKIKQAIQTPHYPIIILNQSKTQQISSFVDFSLEWLQFHNVYKIKTKARIIQSLNQISKNSNLFDSKYHPQSERHYPPALLLKKPSTYQNKNLIIFYIPFQNIETWISILQSLSFYIFSDDYLSNFVAKRCKIIIEYSQTDQRSIRFLQMDKRLMFNAIVLSLNLRLESLLNSEEVCKFLIKNEKFNGDYDKAVQLSIKFMAMYKGLQKMISSFPNNRLSEQRKGYLRSEQNYFRFISTFVDLYYFTEIEFKASIDLISSGLGQINALSEQYAYKKLSQKNLKLQIYQTRSRLDALNQTKNNLLFDIQNYFTTPNYKKKLQLLHSIQLKNSHIQQLLQHEQNLKNQSLQYSNYLTRNELAQLKYLFLNSYQTYHLLFQALTLLILDDPSEINIKKLILDINLLSKLKQINFQTKDQKKLLQISEKISLFVQKQQKSHTLNFFQWLKYTTDYNLTKITNKKSIASIQEDIKFLQELIQNIDKQERIAQKENEIEALAKPIQLLVEKLNNLERKHQENEILLKVDREVNNCVQFAVICKNAKEKYQNQYSLLVCATFYTAIWINYVSFLTEQDKHEEQSTLDTFNRTVIDLIYRQILPQNLLIKQQLLQFLVSKPQQSLYLFLNDIKNSSFTILQKSLEDNSNQNLNNTNINHIKAKDAYNQEKISNFYLKSKITHTNFTKQIRKRILLIHFLAYKDYSSQTIIVDTEFKLLQTFQLLPESAIFIIEDIQKQKDPLRDKNSTKSKKSNSPNQNNSKIKGYCSKVFNYFNFANKTWFFFIRIPDDAWEIGKQIRLGRQKEFKQIQIKIGTRYYRTSVEVPQQIKLQIVFFKNKIKNLTSSSYKYHIFWFGGPIVSHQKQIIQKSMIYNLSLYQHINIRKHLESVDKDDGTKILLEESNFENLIIEYYKENVWIFQRQYTHLKALQQNIKFMCQSQKKLSIYDKEYILEFNAKVLFWKSLYTIFLNFDTIIPTYLSFMKELIDKTLQNFITFYKIILKVVLSVFSPEERRPSNSISPIYGRKNYLQDFLSYLQEAFQYVITSQWNEKYEQKIDTIQKYLCIVQKYVLKRLILSEHGSYITILVYLYEQQQNGQTNYKNLLYDQNLSDSISSLLNCKIGCVELEKLKTIPGNCFEIESFMRKFFKQLKNAKSPLKLADEEMIRNYIENYFYETRVMGKKKLTKEQEVQENQLRKLGELNKFMLKKYLIPQTFYKEIYLKSKEKIQYSEGGGETEQAGDIWEGSAQLRTNIQRFLCSSKAWIYFGECFFWYSFISELLQVQFCNRTKIKISVLLKKEESIQYQLETIKGFDGLILLFDFRYQQQRLKNKSSEKEVQKIKREENQLKKKICTEYRDIRHCGVLVFADWSLEEYFYQVEELREDESLWLGIKQLRQLNVQFGKSISCSGKQMLQRILADVFSIDFDWINPKQTQIKNKQLYNPGNTQRQTKDIVKPQMPATPHQLILNTFKSSDLHHEVKSNNNLQPQLGTLQQTIQLKKSSIKISSLHPKPGKPISKQSTPQLRQIIKYIFAHLTNFNFTTQSQILFQLIELIRVIGLYINKKESIISHSNEQVLMRPIRINQNSVQEKTCNETQNLVPFVKYIQANYCALQNPLNVQQNSCLLLKSKFQFLYDQLLTQYQSNSQGTKTNDKPEKFNKSFQNQDKTYQNLTQRSFEHFPKSDSYQIQNKNLIRLSSKLFYPKKTYKLFINTKNNKLVQLFDSANIILKSKFKLLSLLQQQSKVKLQNLSKIEQKSSDSDSSSSISNKDEKRGVGEPPKIGKVVEAKLLRLSEEKNMKELKRKSMNLESNNLRKISRRQSSIIEETSKKRFKSVNQRLEKPKRDSEIQRQLSRTDLHRIVQNFEHRESINKTITNSPLIVERRYRKAKYRDSFSRVGNSKRLTLLPNHEEPIQIELLKEISLKKFTINKSQRTIAAFMQCYQNIKKLVLLKSGALPLQEEIIFLSNQFSNSQKHPRFLNHPFPLALKDQFQTKGTKKCHKNHHQQLEWLRWNVDDQFLDQEILKQCFHFEQALKSFHRIKSQMFKIGETQIERAFQNFGPHKKQNLLIIEEETPNGDKMMGEIINGLYEDTVRNIYLHNELLNIKNVSSACFQHQNLLQLQCCQPQNISFRFDEQRIQEQNQMSPPQGHKQRGCEYCFGFENFNKAPGKSSFRQKSLTYPLAQIKINRKLYEIHMLLRRNWRKIQYKTLGSVISGDELDDEIVQMPKKYNTLNQPSIVIIHRSSFRIPLTVQCPRCINQILRKK